MAARKKSQSLANMRRRQSTKQNSAAHQRSVEIDAKNKVGRYKAMAGSESGFRTKQKRLAKRNGSALARRLDARSPAEKERNEMRAASAKFHGQIAETRKSMSSVAASHAGVGGSETVKSYTAMRGGKNVAIRSHTRRG